MNPAEGLYRILLRLYPAWHRQAYGPLMLQHARDLGCAARRQGRWRLVICCLRLVKDAIVNAGIEHLEILKMVDNKFKPVPWLSVVLACIPGLLFALSRSYSNRLGIGLAILGYAYLALLVIGLPILWWRKRQFPVWGLLPLGILTWWFTYFGGVALSQLADSLPIPGLWPLEMETCIMLLDLIVVIVLFAILLRGRRFPRSFWLTLAGIGLINILVAVYLIEWIRYDTYRKLLDIFSIFSMAGYGLLEGLMLVTVGALAARQHGHLALLVVLGGYSSWFLDSDYLWLHPSRAWTGVEPFLVGVTFLFMVITPLTLLRARTRRARALALFVPTIIFNIARLITPSLVYHLPMNWLSGDVMLSVNMLLFLALAWNLYDYLGKAALTPVMVEHSSEQVLEQTTSAGS